MPDSFTSLQSHAMRRVDALVESRGHSLQWTEEPGPLRTGDRMLVGRTGALTIWLYDDGIDYRLKDSEVVNFEALNYQSEGALLSAVLEHLAQFLPPNAQRNA